MNEFQINFNYQEVNYTGLITPIENPDTLSYKVNLESGNQESFVEIIAKPSDAMTGEWEFECSNGDNPVDYYDKKLLQEIGEAIEKKLISQQ